MITVEIFNFNNEKLKDAYEVRRNVFIEEQQIPEELEIDDLEKDAHHLVIYNNNLPIGAGRMRILDRSIGKLERICVKKIARKQGVGEMIMNAFEQFGLENGITSFKLNAQDTAVPFYEKLGYTITSDLFYDAGIPHYEMRKTRTK